MTGVCTLLYILFLVLVKFASFFLRTTFCAFLLLLLLPWPFAAQKRCILTMMGPLSEREERGEALYCGSHLSCASCFLLCTFSDSADTEP